MPNNHKRLQARACPGYARTTSWENYLRSTMTQTRLSDLALLYIERDLSSRLWDQIDVLKQLALVLRFAEARIVALTLYVIRGLN